MFAPGVFLHVFQLLNNWPRLALFMFENSVFEQALFVDIQVTRPRPFREELPRFANTRSEMLADYGALDVSVCGIVAQKNLSVFEFHWEVFCSSDESYRQTSTNCSTRLRAPQQGYCTIEVSGESRDNRSLLRGRRELFVEDVWIAAVGDSFASGEGNPDRPAMGDAPARWLSEKCHRSSHSWAFKLASRIEKERPGVAVHFSFVACTGASVEAGLLAPYRREPAQFDVLDHISRHIGRGPDVLLMTLGGNDVGYAEILHSLAHGRPRDLFSTISMRFFYVSDQLNRVAERISSLRPARVIVPVYFDISRNERGDVDANCAEFPFMNTEVLKEAEKLILQRLNGLLVSTGKRVGWTVVQEVLEVFATRGLCSSISLIRNLKDSMRLERSDLGAFHPTEEAHTLIASILHQYLRLLP